MERNDLVVKKRGGGERVITAERYWIDRNTPVGEDADYYEIKPYGGKRYIPIDSIIRKIPRND